MILEGSRLGHFSQLMRPVSRCAIESCGSSSAQRHFRSKSQQRSVANASLVSMAVSGLATREPNAESLQLIEQLRILGSNGKWQEVLELTYAQQRADVLVYEAALVAIAPHGRWQEALQLMLRTRQSSHNCSSCMFACMSGGQPEQALAVFDSMRSRGLKPGPYAFSVAISICVKDRQLQRAASLVCDAVAARCRLDAALVEGVLSASAEEGAWSDIESIWTVMLEVSTLPH
jgi:pentatricopeptide repeat protein